MRILAADTSTMSESLALLEDERLIAEFTLSSGKTHNRRLLKSIDSILGEAGWELESVDAFAVAGGPGSFTGIRIGMATMKTLAWTRGKNFASICSLDALALPLAFSSYPVCALLDARKGEVYCALYRPNSEGALTIEIEHSALSPEVLANELISRTTEPIVFCGDGWAAYREVFRNKLGRQTLAPPAPFHVIRAASVAELARRRFLQGDSDDPGASAPFYLRPSEAEIHYPHLAEQIDKNPEII